MNGERAEDRAVRVIAEALEDEARWSAWSEIPALVVAALAARGGVVVWQNDADAIDAMAAALHTLDGNSEPWRYADPILRDDYREDAEAALRALLPVIPVSESTTERSET